MTATTPSISASITSPPRVNPMATRFRRRNPRVSVWKNATFRADSSAFIPPLAE